MRHSFFFSACTYYYCIQVTKSSSSVETNIYFGTNRILNIIRLMKIEQIEYCILFAHQENIQIVFKYLKIFKYMRINLQNNVKVSESKIFIYPKITF